MKISDKIAVSVVKKGKVSSTSYSIKVINLSLFPAFDVTASLEQLTPYPVDGGVNFKSTTMYLVKSELPYIADFRRKKEFGEYAAIFRTEQNIKEILEHSDFEVRFQITLRHGVTGLSKVFHQKFTQPSSLVNGKFKFGNSVEIS